MGEVAQGPVGRAREAARRWAGAGLLLAASLAGAPAAAAPTYVNYIVYPSDDTFVQSNMETRPTGRETRSTSGCIRRATGGRRIASGSAACRLGRGW
jgi:hypothetical protein